MIERGQIWWAQLSEPRGSEPGFTRPLLIAQADSFNRSQIHTVLAITLSSNLRLAHAPGNVLLDSNTSGLPKDSVANVSQVVTLDRGYLIELVGRIDAGPMAQIERGLRLVMDL